MSVRRAQQEVDSREFGEWLAFMSQEPMGVVREDFNAALPAFITAASNCAKGKQPKFEDFIPDYWGERKSKAMSANEMKSILMAWASAANEVTR